MNTEDTEKKYCCNCLNCKVIKIKLNEQKYKLRTKCDEGMWQTKRLEEKTYKYNTVNKRIRYECEFYDPMGDIEPYLSELIKTLSKKDYALGN